MIGAAALATRLHAPTRTASVGDALEIELSGCAAVLDGPVCELPEDGVLRASVSARPNEVTFAASGTSVPSTVLRELDGVGAPDG